MRAQAETPLALPPAIGQLVRDLVESPGVVAVVLGGSRADGLADADSDWDIGVYDRGAIDLEPLRRYGEVHAPGAWGRIMNGGAWLSLDGVRVDVLLRDLDVTMHWSERAARGEYEIDSLLGYVAGLPTYSLAAERAIARVLRGSLPEPMAFPDRLAEVAVFRWRFQCKFTFEQARARARRGDVVGAVGHAARAVLEASHARMCEARRWVLNEKRLVERAGLAGVQTLFSATPSDPPALARWIDAVEAVEAVVARPLA